MSTENFMNYDHIAALWDKKCQRNAAVASLLDDKKSLKEPLRPAFISDPEIWTRYREEEATYTNSWNDLSEKIRTEEQLIAMDIEEIKKCLPVNSWVKIKEDLWLGHESDDWPMHVSPLQQRTTTPQMPLKHRCNPG